MIDVRLPRNVQFMYEHALANMEFRKGFGADNIEVNPSDPWHFRMEMNGAKQELITRSAYAGTIDGQDSVYSHLIRPDYQGGRFNRTRSVNQYLTHWIYPYKGKFHPQVIRAVLNIIGMKPGCKVLDPFVGSGTTALECELLGIDLVGVDVSPLCVMLSRVKTGAWVRVAEIRSTVEAVIADGMVHPDDLDTKRSEIAEVRDFLEIARMVTYSDVSRRARDPERYLQKNMRNMLQSVEAMACAHSEFGLEFGNVSILEGDARMLRSVGIEDASIDGIVTSPPYSIALDYVKNDEHALKAMGLDTNKIRERFVGVRGCGPKNRIALYTEDLKKAFAEMRRVLKPRSPAVVVIGNATVNGEEERTTEEMVEWASEVGLICEREMPKIAWGLYGVVADEKILFFRRE